MEELINNFPKQLQEALEIGKKIKLNKYEPGISNVLISGLGGSGIGGSIVSELVALTAKVPVSVSKGYFIPTYINEYSLVIISSYSGNTEETINAFEAAIKKKAKIICVTSGGKIAEIATKNAIDLILIPGGMPPRACLGYSLTQLFFILNFFDIIPENFLPQLEASVKLLENNKKAIQLEASSIAGKLLNKIPVIYTTTYKEGIAIRFRQQINENAKMLCWHHVFPEMNHNELVGWRDKHDDIAVIIFRDKQEYIRNNTRIEISKEIISKYTPLIIEVYSKGDSDIERTLYLIHLGDWISCYLAEKKGMDAVEVAVIDHLKSELARK